MGPDRTKHSRKNAKAGPSNSASVPKALSMDKRDGSGVPGVSKLKASLRQTKRLLAKDNLEPGLRITTERRLVSLEADLASAQKRDVEKKNGAKYHQVKFFERQKLQRIIKRVKRSQVEAEDGSKAQKKLEKELKEARIMLNYVRHYPNTEKYIALFPSTSGAGEEAEADSETSTLKLPKVFKAAKGEVDESTTKRREILDRISGMMEKGELPTEPENAVSEKKAVSLAVGSGGAKAGVKDKAVTEQEDDDFFDVDGDEDES